MEQNVERFQENKDIGFETIRIVEDSVTVLHVAICDDEQEHLEQIVQVMKQTKLNVELCIETYHSAKELLEILDQRKKESMVLPEVIFSDIEMSELDGISFGKAVRKIAPESYLIFITAYAEYAVKGYEARAFRYLLKPVTQDILEEVLQEILQEQGQKKKLLVKSAEEERVLQLQEVIYLSAEDKYTILYTSDGHFIDRTALREYEEVLAPHGFYRIHRKYIVNVYHHKCIRRGKVVLSSGVELPISRRREAAYREKVLKDIEKELLK